MRYKITDIPNIRGLGVGKEKPLDELTKKEVLSFLDYAIILSTMYGIGSGLGIIAGTASSVLPDRKKKPAIFYLCIVLLILGTSRGYITAAKSQKLKKLLQNMDV